MARYTFKNFDQEADVVNQVNQPIQYLWSFTSAGVFSDGSGDKWEDSTASAYVIHAVASAGDSSSIENSFGGTLDGDITSEDLYYSIGTKYFDMSNPSSGFSWSEGTNVTKIYVVSINNDLTLDLIKGNTFRIGLSGAEASPASSVHEFVLNTTTDDQYPQSSIIRYADTEGSLSSTNVGVAFLTDGLFCFLSAGDEAAAGTSGLLWDIFVNDGVSQSSLPPFFTDGSAGGICNSMSANSVEYQNSFIYFCRALNKEFNYSLNPTFGSSADAYTGTYRIKPELQDDPKTYTTGVALFDDDGDQVAVAKLNVPRKKDFFTEALYKVKITI